MSKTIIINRLLSDSEIVEIKRLSEAGANVFSISASNSMDFAERILLSPEEKKTDQL